MSKTRAAAGGALLAIVIASGGAQAAFADATPHPSPAGAATTQAAPMEGMEMEGKDHGTAPVSTTASALPPTSGEQTASNHSHNGMPVASTAPPRTLALGGFAALNGAVLATAGVLRRRGARGRAMRISPQHSAL